jgi:RNA polymerase sigma factor (sigma-70 family)
MRVDWDTSSPSSPRGHLRRFASSTYAILLRHAFACIGANCYPAFFDVEDVVQETYLIICEEFHRFKGTTRREFCAWAKVILRYRLQNLRRHHSALKRDSRAVISLEELDPQTGAEPAAKDPLPEELLLRKETTDLLEYAIDRLPRSAATTFRLIEVEGHSLIEVAEILKVSERTVHKWLRFACEQLRTMLLGDPRTRDLFVP